MTLVGMQTEGEAELHKEMTTLRTRVVQLEATVKHLLILNGIVPDDFEWEAIEQQMTALEAKANLASGSLKGAGE